MAYPGKIIRNLRSGQDIEFLKTSKETGGALLEMKTTYNAGSKEPAAHYHPYQEEYFVVLEGEVAVRRDGEMMSLKKGDTLHIPPGSVHAMWNRGSDKAVVSWRVTPAMDTEYFLEGVWGLAADGKLNKKGMPPLLQVALMMKKYSDVFRLVKPPFVIQKIVFNVLAPVAYLAGYRATYKQYLD